MPHHGQGDVRQSRKLEFGDAPWTEHSVGPEYPAGWKERVRLGGGSELGLQGHPEGKEGPQRAGPGLSVQSFCAKGWIPWEEGSLCRAGA